MKLPSRKLLSITIAILLGAGIIFFALKTVSFNGGTATFEAESADHNGSWRDALKVIPQDSLTRLRGSSVGSSSSTAATTTTDLLGRELLTSYALAQKSIGKTPMTTADATAISNILAGKVMSDVSLKEYSEKDLWIVPTNNSSLSTYQKELATIFDSFSRKNTVNELKVVYEAVEKRDAAILAPLASTEKKLQALIDTLLKMKVPQSTTVLHLFFLQNYTLILSGVADMRSIVEDPVLGMRGVAKYRQGMNTITRFVDILNASH